MKLWIDFETYSDIDIKKMGLYKYIWHPSFQVWCCGYAINNEEVELLVGSSIPAELLDPNVLIYAHNAEFEWQVLKRLGYDIPLRRFVDTAALAGTYGYPLSLDKFAKAVGLSQGKDSSGTRLINKLCKPQKRTIKNPSGRWYPKTASKDFQKLYDYCKQDVKVMRDAVAMLPKDRLLPIEEIVWGHTLTQNERGFRIDLKSVTNINSALTTFYGENQAKFQKLTGLNSSNQTAKLKDFCHSWGVMIPNLQKETVNDFLEKNIQYEVREALKLRQMLSHNVSKFEKMLNMVQDDQRIRGNLAYHAAHTGRWGGRGVQIHNLLRANHKNPEEVLYMFNTESYKAIKYMFPDLPEAAAKLIRAVIIPDDNKKFVVGDFKSVENVMLHWVANDKKTTQDFRNGLDQYKVYSAERLNKPYDEVTKDERRHSKPDVLGLGYGASYKALIGVAAGYGVMLTKPDAIKRVKYYRKKYKEVVQLWDDVHTNMLLAVLHKSVRVLDTGTIKLTFEYDNGNLWIYLPSGRSLFYKDVLIDAVWYVKKIPFTSKISYMGVKTNQWCRIGTHPGMLVENIVSALARDCLAYGLLCVEQAGYKVLASVHDEIITEVPNNYMYTVDGLCKIMCKKRSWYEELPLFADGWEGYRYKKD